MKKILIDCERLKYPNTGLHTFCSELGRALIHQKKKELDYTFYVPPSSVNYFGTEINYKIFNPLHKLYIPNTDKYNVWHKTHQGSPYQPYNAKTKIVYTVHDLNFLVEKKHSVNKIKSYLNKIQQNINRADVITCISDFAKQQVLDNIHVENKEIVTIYNGVSVNEFPDFNSPKFLPKKPFLFTLGTVLPKKNFHVLPCLLQHNDFDLIIAGNLSRPEYIEKIKQEAKLFGVENRVHIIGSINEKEKYWYYKNCEAFVFPSLAEGFGIPAIEAMLFGKPVFLSSLTSLPEIGGKVAYYFNNFSVENMQAVLDNGLTHYKNLTDTKTIIAHAQQFTWEKAAQAYQKIYLSL